MSGIYNKNRLRKKSAPSYPEISSGDVHPSILGSATDTAQTSRDADTNIANVTKGAKNDKKKVGSEIFLQMTRSFPGMLVVQLKHLSGSPFLKDILTLVFLHKAQAFFA